MKLLNLIIVGILLIGGSNTTILASTGANFLDPITVPSPASCYPLGYQTIEVPLTNNLAISLNAIVFGVFHNSIGQTLEVSTSSVIVSGGQNLTTYVIITLPYGNYTVNVFAWAVNGLSLSSEQSNVAIDC